MKEAQGSLYTKWDEAKEFGRIVVPRVAVCIGGLFGMSYLLWGNQEQQSSVPAIVATPQNHGVDALLPSHNNQPSRSVTLTDGTRVLLNCLTGNNNEQLDITVESGDYAHQGGDRVVLTSEGNPGLKLESGASLPTEEC